MSEPYVRSKKGDRLMARYALEGADALLAEPDVQRLVKQYRERVEPAPDKSDAEVLDTYVRYLANCRGAAA